MIASQDQHQTGGKQTLKVTPSWERPPTVYGPLGVGHSVPILGSVYDRNQAAKYSDPSIQGQEASLESTAAGVNTPDSKVRDHLLLTVQAVVHGTPLRALVDSGATRSFVDERIQLHPPLHFIGAYSSLEMANGETIVSTGVAPDVLISLGDIQFRSTLTAVPMMEGFDLNLGKDWLDMINPLVDWRSNTVYIQSGDQLQRVSGISAEEVKPCGIVDRGLAGLQDNFSQLHNESDTCLQFGKWGETYAQLASPTFWEYKTTANDWTPGPTGTLAQPQGEVTPSTPVTPTIFSNSLADAATILKTGPSNSSKQDKKIEFISLKKTIKMAQSKDTPILLAVVRLIRNEDIPKKNKKPKTKTRAGTIHGRTEGEKRRMLKESGPAKDTTTVKDTMKDMVEKADRAVRGELSRILEEYGDVFPEKLPYGPPPKRMIDHEIEVVPGSEPPHKSPYRLSNAEMEELRNQVETLLEQGWIRPSSSPYGAPVVPSPNGATQPRNGQGDDGS